MSQIYRVQLSSSLVETLEAHDEMRHRVELTPILDAGDMADVLRKVLAEQGWEEQEDGTFEKAGEHGETMVWDLEENVVIARVDAERTVEIEIDATGSSESKQGAQREAERALARRQVHAKVQLEETERALVRRLSKSLEDGEEGRERALHGVLERVYSEAIQRKAAQLGTVLSVEERETDDEYELVIHVAESS